MEIYDIIEALNEASDCKSEGQYILHRSMERQSIKAYKKFLYKLYFVKGTEKELVLTHQNIVQVSSADLDTMWRYQDSAFLVPLLTWFKYGKVADK